MRTKLLVILFFSLITAFSQNSSKYSNEFLNIGVDARSIGMANAVVSSVNDVNSTYWNPAGLLNIERDEISLMHSNYFANIQTITLFHMLKVLTMNQQLDFL